MTKSILQLARFLTLITNFNAKLQPTMLLLTKLIVFKVN